MYIGDQIRYNYVAKNFPAAKSKNLYCLDIGCGNQIYRDLVRKNGYGYIGIDKNITGNDVQKVDLDNEEEIIKVVKVNYSSVVLCIDVLEHLKDPYMLFSFLPDMLNTHGRLIIHVPNKNQTHILVDPKKNSEHIQEGFTPEDLYNSLAKFFPQGRFSIIPTFNLQEAIAWDLNYIRNFSESLTREKLLFEGIEKALNFDVSKFIPYGLLAVGDR